MSLSETSDTVPPPQLEPTLPYANCSLSYWHRTTRAFPHLNENQTNPVPASAKYVIIGAGIAGALTAFELLEAGMDPKDVLMIEAREAVSGSSGRNAGHVRPDACSGFGGYVAAHGAEQALKIVDDERLVLDRVTKFVQQHDISCDFSLKQTFDVCLTQEIADDEARNVKQYIEAGGDMDHIKLFEGKAAVEITGVPNAISTWEWPAASIHPAKLAQWLLSNVIGRGCKLWTHCPVTQVAPSEGAKWDIHTPRGIVSTEKVIHCTNVYAGFLLPQLSINLLTPIKVQVQSFVPTVAFSGEKTLKNTMALRYEPARYYAMNQNRGDGMIIFGVARPTGITFDETTFDPELVTEAVQQFETLFPDPHELGSRHGEGLDHAWSGLIAMTPDHVPYVGAIEELPGQYICAGFNGHGMARIFTCVPGLVKLMLGGSWSDTKLPESFCYSRDRISGGK